MKGTRSKADRREASQRVVRRLGEMVRRGRISQEDAERLREAGESGEDVALQLRLEHAKETLAAAVEEGAMTKGDADEVLARLARGEHPRGLRRQLNELRRGPASFDSG